MPGRGRLRRTAEGAADWLVAASDMTTATWRRLRPGPPATPGSDPDCAAVPIVLLPGILEPWTYMAPLARHLEGRGHPVHHVETLGWNLAGIESSVERTRALLHDRGLTGAVIVAHSKGGMIGKAVLAAELTVLDETPPSSRVVGMVTLATPWSGSSLGGRWQRLPLVGRSPLGMFLPDSAQLRSLAAEREVNSRIVSLSPAWDQVIPDGSHLEGATNVDLPAGGHFRPLRQTAVHDEIHRRVHAVADET